MTLDKPIPEAQFFRVEGGKTLPSLLAMRAYLRMIPQREFDAHVGAGRNDFASWVEQVFDEKALAKRLRACRTREEMVWALDDAFSELRMQRVMRNEDVSLKPQPRIAEAPDAEDPAVYVEDAAFAPHKDGIAQANERISKRYEDIAKSLQDALQDPMPKETERAIESLRNRHGELLARISEARKGGKDVLMPALVIRQFLPKLAYARASREQKDLDTASGVLDDAERELAEALAKDEPDLKKEVMAMAGIDDAKKGAQTAAHGTQTTTNAYKQR